MTKKQFNIPLRPRRLRENDAIRKLVKENHVTKDDLIYPLFVRNGKKIKSPIPSMPDIYQFSPDSILKEVDVLLNMGLNRIILFGIPDFKDEIGRDAISQNGIIQQTINGIKKRFPEMYIISDVCICEYTNHGHCGIVENKKIKNDKTLKYLQKQAISHAESGVDMVAPSGMMDGVINAIRKELDENDFTNIPILSYSVKYASSFYSPFRDAVDSSPQFGDRSQYQMDISNSREALKEVELDISEGADIIMVKPAMTYLDIIHQVREISNLPIAAYNVSGEYSMIKAAANKGWINETEVVNEILHSIKRAGADIIITYFAKSFLKVLEDK